MKDVKKNDRNCMFESIVDFFGCVLCALALKGVLWKK